MQDHRYPVERKDADNERGLRRMGYVDNAGRGDCVGVWACMAAEAEDGVEEAGGVDELGFNTEV